MNRDGLDDFAVLNARLGVALVVPGATESYAEQAREAGGLPDPIHGWTFEGDAGDAFGSADASLFGGAQIVDGDKQDVGGVARLTGLGCWRQSRGSGQRPDSQRGAGR